MITVNMQLLQAILITLSIGTIAGYLGTLMITKRMALMGGALGHLALPGMALALVYHFDVFFGALAFVGIGMIIIWMLEKNTKLPIEALTAVVFAVSTSVAFLFLPKAETIPALVGDISRITPYNTALTLILSGFVFFATKWLYASMALASISQDLAKIQYRNFTKRTLIFLMCIALTISLGVRIVGGLMTAAIVAIPAATSKNFSHSMMHYIIGSIICSITACTGGILISYYWYLPPGPIIIIVSGIQFLVSLILAKRN